MSTRFPIIDPTKLGDLTLVQVPDQEAIIRARMLLLKQRWSEHDPIAGAQYDVENTEFDPLKIAQEVGAAFEMNAFNFVNQMGRATTLAFAWGDNLDAIGSRYPGGLPRQAGEEDDRYRRRIWLAANAFNTAGAEEGYVFWALTTMPTLRDATATVQRASLAEEPIVVVALLKESDFRWRVEDRPTTVREVTRVDYDPIPTAADVTAVRSTFNRRDIRPASDVVSVEPAQAVPVAYDVGLYLYPNVDIGGTLDAAMAALQALEAKQRWLGHDHTRLAIAGALDRIGVQNAAISSPPFDVVASPRQFVRVDSIRVEYLGVRE